MFNSLSKHNINIILVDFGGRSQFTRGLKWPRLVTLEHINLL